MRSKTAAKPDPSWPFAVFITIVALTSGVTGLGCADPRRGAGWGAAAGVPAGLIYGVMWAAIDRTPRSSLANLVGLLLMGLFAGLLWGAIAGSLAGAVGKDLEAWLTGRGSALSVACWILTPVLVVAVAFGIHAWKHRTRAP